MTAPLANIRKIAVLRANVLGDFLFALPAFTALRETYPASEIVLLGLPWPNRPGGSCAALPRRARRCHARFR